MDACMIERFIVFAGREAELACRLRCVNAEDNVGSVAAVVEAQLWLDLKRAMCSFSCEN